MSPDSLPLSLAMRVNEICDRFEAAWKAGQRPAIEDYMAAIPEPEQGALLAELLALEIELRRNSGDVPDPGEYERRFPEHGELIRAAFAEARSRERASRAGEPSTSSRPSDDNSEVDESTPLPPLPAESPSPLPERIGRYKVCRKLGGGTFGNVYLAQDDVMDRQVAIKLPSPRLAAALSASDLWRFEANEARMVSRLQHEGIVRVYDLGLEADGRCYIVYEFVEGTNLAERINATDPLPLEQAVRIVAQVAEALHYAHLQDRVHRDIKPANILLDRQGRPRITDFGLAVREEDLPQERGRLAGTLPYMSPEQVRREGHLDGRSDIYSLGVVLYELLCGRRPFEAKKESELKDQILHREAKPPRQIIDSIPAELERICLKAIAKRITDRYTTARDLSDDLRRFQESHGGQNPPESETDRTADPQNLLHLIWDSMDSHLQDAFSLAYNKKRRDGSNRISTRDLFQALLRVRDDALRTLIESLPEGALPDPVGSDVGVDRHLLNANPLLSDCVENSLRHFLRSCPLPRKLSPVDIFVDIGQHGHGPSVARLRKHGISPEELERRVQKHGLSVLRRVTSDFDRLAKPSLAQNVQFTVYRPKTIRPQEWYPMLAFAHLSERASGASENEPDPVQEVKRQALQILGEKREYGEMTQDSTRLVPQEGELTFVPEVSGIEFNPPLRSFVWAETVHREEFRLRASAELDGQTAKGRMTVFLGSIILAEVALSIRVDSSYKPAAKTEPHEEERARPYRKIFASYSRKDSWVVGELKRYARALGDEYVRKHSRLRAGEEWSDHLRQLIEEADIFQLFWSSNSMYSPFVRREWECALALGRANFIRPCYWEEPLPTCPEKNLPPEELRHLHFQRIPVALPEAEDASRWRERPVYLAREMRDEEEGFALAREIPRSKIGAEDAKLLADLLRRHWEAFPTTPEAPTKGVQDALGQYVIDQQLGAGGLNRVFRGHHIRDPLRPLVIKVVPASSHNKELWLRNYRRIAQLRHPGIMKVAEAGVQEGLPYVVTDYLEGPSLQDWLKDHRPTWKETTRIVAAIAEALDFLHVNGLVHRDVKPSHILLANYDNPILIGFGLATSMSEKEITGAGAVVGSPAYMPPEKILGQRVDSRADIYSLGVVLYEMLCGKHPFADNVVWERLRRVREEEPPPPRQQVPAIPRELEAICLKAMAKRVNDRYTTGADLAADLRRCLEGLPVTTGGRAAVRWKPLLLVALAVSAILAGLIWWFFF